MVCMWVMLSVGVTYAQQLSLPDLVAARDQDPEITDSVLRERHFMMDPVSYDSTGTLLRYYNQVVKNEKGITWIRSLTITEVRVKETLSRLVNYRIYDEEEYRNLLFWLLEHQFKHLDHFDFRGAKHVIYSNGELKVVVKEGKKMLPNKRTVMSYEVEIG